MSRTCAFGVTLEATRTQEGSHGAQRRCSRPGALFPYVRCPAVRVRHILDCPGSCCKRAADCHEGLEEPNQACRLGSDTVGLKLVPVLKLHKFSLGIRTGKLQNNITHQPQLSLIAALQTQTSGLQGIPSSNHPQLGTRHGLTKGLITFLLKLLAAHLSAWVRLCTTSG